MPGEVELRPGIDGPWLEREGDRDPVGHAYMLWDVARWPDLSQVVSAVVAGETVGYLLVWLGRPERPVVHWYRPDARADRLVERFPRPPFVAVVPVDADARLDRLAPRRRSERMTLMLRPRGLPSPGASTARRLTGADGPAVLRLAAGRPDRELAGYVGLDLETEPAWGVFEAGRLVGVARATVRLPVVWVLGGVFVEPTARGRGLGATLVGAFLREAERAGAPAGLFVLESAAPALRLYERLGFRATGTRLWVDARGPEEP